MDELLKEACEARADLERVFADIAASLSAMADVMNEAAIDCKAAVSRETAATSQYISALERIIAQYQSGAGLN